MSAIRDREPFVFCEEGDNAAGDALSEAARALFDIGKCDRFQRCFTFIGEAQRLSGWDRSKNATTRALRGQWLALRKLTTRAAPAMERLTRQQFAALVHKLYWRTVAHIDTGISSAETRTTSCPARVRK